MAFQQILDDLIASVPESLAATLTDQDGEAVVTRTIQVPNEALQLLGAYQQTVRRHLAAAVEEFDRGRWSRSPSPPRPTGSCSWAATRAAPLSS